MFTIWNWFLKRERLTEETAISLLPFLSDLKENKISYEINPAIGGIDIDITLYNLLPYLLTGQYRGNLHNSGMTVYSEIAEKSPFKQIEIKKVIEEEDVYNKLLSDSFVREATEKGFVFSNLDTTLLVGETHFTYFFGKSVSLAKTVYRQLPENLENFLGRYEDIRFDRVSFDEGVFKFKRDRAENYGVFYR